MAMSKVSVTVDAEILAEARALAQGNLSALVGEALVDRVRLERLRQLLDDDERELGPIPEQIVDHVDREWARLSSMPAS